MSEKPPVFGAWFIHFALAFSVAAILLREIFELLLPALGLATRWALPAAVATAIVAMNQFPEDRRIALVARLKALFGRPQR